MRAKKRGRESERPRERERERELERRELEKWQRFRTTSAAMAGPSNMEKADAGRRRANERESRWLCLMRQSKEEERRTGERSEAHGPQCFSKSEALTRSLASSLAFIYNSASGQEPNQPTNPQPGAVTVWLRPRAVSPVATARAVLL